MGAALQVVRLVIRVIAPSGAAELMSLTLTVSGAAVRKDSEAEVPAGWMGHITRMGNKVSLS